MPLGPVERAVMVDGRWAATATLLSDGRVLVAGGYSFAKKNTVASVDLFDPRSSAFAPAAAMTTDRNFATATLLSDGRVLVAGGFAEKHDGSLDGAELYDPKTNTWTPTKNRLADRRELFTATRLPDGKVLLVGGLSLKKRTTLLTAEVYDPATETFTRTVGLLADDRFGHAAAPLPGGKVLVVGGQSWRIGQPSRTLATAEIFDPATGLFTPAGSLRAARDRPTATLLLDGRVLVAGGTNQGTPPLAAEIFDPKTGIFESVAPLAEGRMAHDAALLADGRVLVAGGWSDARRVTTPRVEVYDVKANTWTKRPDLPFAAHDLVLVPLNGGRLLAVGGKSTTGDEKTAVSIDAAAVLK